VIDVGVYASKFTHASSRFLSDTPHSRISGARSGSYSGLDLAHSRSATDTWTGVGAAAGAEAGHDGGGEEGGEAEPEEGGRGLGFAAALAGALVDVVGVEVSLLS